MTKSKMKVQFPVFSPFSLMFFSFSCPFSSFLFQEDAILEDVGEKGEGGKKGIGTVHTHETRVDFFPPLSSPSSLSLSVNFFEHGG